MPNLNALKAAIDNSPKNVPLLLLYAFSCLEELSLPEARATFESVLEKDPENAEAQLGVARVLFLDGKTSESAVRVQRLLQNQPDFAPAHVFLSRIYMSEEDHDRAVEHYRTALLINKAMSDPALERELSSVRDHQATQGNDSSRSSNDDGPGATNTGDEWRPADSFFSSEEEFEEGSGSYYGEDDVDDDRLVGPRVFSLKDFPRPQKSFADVAGLEWLKEEIRMRMLYPLERPELFRAYGKRSGGSLLLYGPPGCGKTLVSRAIAGEVSLPFFEVELHHVLELYAWGSERNVHQIFDLAREHAPSVVFIDELDAIAGDRLEAPPNGSRTLVSQLLHEIEGCSAQEEGVFVIGATNAPWNLDAAFQRPGRFDRRVLVPLPDDATRAAIIEHVASDKPRVDLDTARLVEQTAGFSGADLRFLFDVATEAALRQALEEDKVVPLTNELLQGALRRVEPSARGWQKRVSDLGWAV